jgi:hypothetical protein
MIKVQPAHSRILKTEDPDRIRLETPAEGILSLGGAMALLGLVWTGLAAWGGAVSLQSEHREFAIVAAIAMAPALLVLAGGILLCCRRWTIERTAECITFEKRGLFRGSQLTWNAQDVSSVYVKRSDFNQEFVLIFGFRNGHSEEVVQNPSEEEMQWVAAMLSDPRGNRRPAPQSLLQTPATPRVRTDESIVPASLGCLKDAGGVELSFRALIHFKRRWSKLLGGTLLVFAGILGAAAVLERWSPTSPLLARVALVTTLLVLFGRMLILNRTAVVRIRDGAVTIVQNQLQGHHRFPAGEVEFIQTFRGSGDTELQFLLRGKPKLRLFRGRPADELEWAARFLRVALKAKSEEAAPMTVDATAGECQVCGERMETRVVFCAKCRTPHHEECWTYVGQCSTYGCREIRFTRS